MAASEETVDAQKVEASETCDGAKKRFPGVTKRRNKWIARVRNQVRGGEFYLGCHATHEEAALAVKNKRAELQEMYNRSQDGSSARITSSYFERKKLPCGVRMQNGTFHVRVWDPRLKKMVSGASYKTLDEAVKAADRKREELREMCGGELTVFTGNVGDGEVVKESGCVVESKSDLLDEQTGDVKVPRGVRRINKTGKWVARIKKPDSKDRIWLGTYNTVEEAISSYNQKKAEFDAKLKKPDLDWVKFRPGTESTETPMKFECGFGYEYDCLGDGFVDRSTVSDETFDSGFERAVSLGIINEYGQLLGKHSEVDDFLRLSLPEENVMDSCAEGSLRAK